MATKTRSDQCSGSGDVLYVALELSNARWLIASTVGPGRRPRRKSVAALDFDAVMVELEAAKKRFGLPPDAAVVSCHEVGRDGFSVHRGLVAAGIESVPIDAASLKVTRRRRQVKTDRIDVERLLADLIRWHGGETSVWRVVQVPTVEQEDQRQLSRELEELKGERTRLGNRITSLVVTQGARIRIGRGFEASLSSLELPAHLESRIRREHERLQLVEEQIDRVEAIVEAMVAEPETPLQQTMRDLRRIKGIGRTGAMVIAAEAFGWRAFHNGKQVGSYLGLTGTPFQSGDLDRDQGITKAGNHRLRALAIQIAWGWLRFQHDSALSKWFHERFGGAGKRSRKVGIVALARKLMIALWQYTEHGVLPEGAVLGG